MKENKIKAEIVLGSENEFGNKIVTWKLTFPRIILAEVNTHRMLSRNSASSRAIPFERILERVETEPFIPIKWLKDHPGMQGEDYWPEDSEEAKWAEQEWLKARDWAVTYSKRLSGGDITKQFCNRLLEPFMWHVAIVTMTEFENWCALRAHHMAEIHIQDLAYKMLEEYNKYEFQQLEEGEWHIPFQELIDVEELQVYSRNNNIKDNDWNLTRAKISAGICAGISYGRVKDKIDIADMLDLHDSLVLRPYQSKFKRGTRDVTDPIHASPTEHQARAMSGDTIFYEETVMGMSANFYGFEQYRQMIPNENAQDKRVKK